jgi:hypothetical protein
MQNLGNSVNRTVLDTNRRFDLLLQWGFCLLFGEKARITIFDGRRPVMGLKKPGGTRTG